MQDNQNKPIYYVCVAGYRNFKETEENYNIVSNYLDFALSRLKESGEIVIVHGACPRGVDMLADRYSRRNNYKCIQFRADWDSLGRSAGPERNKRMCDFSDYFICFWNGSSRGTMNMIQNVKAAK